MKKHQKVRREDDALVIQKRNSFRRNSPRWRKALTWAVTAWTLGMAPAVYASDAALPVLDAKDAAVSIVTSGNVMNITSVADNNLIKWVDFSIASGKTVDFHDKNYLNYVTGSARSDILGTLTGGNHIYLVNPNGILIGDGATVNVGSLHLSTKQLDAAALTSYDTGMTALASASIGIGDVINMGRLNADTIIVEGNNITFKNTADVTKDGNLVETGNGYDISGGTVHNSDAVKLTASDAKDAKGNYLYEIHIGSTTGGDLPAYSMNGTDKKYMYKLVSTAAELQNMNNNRSASYMLANDVDMKNFGNFTPIGTFWGRFDGLNHQIQNLTINSGADNVGLFGHVLGPGVIENVGLVGGSVTGQSFVGGIVGYNQGGTIRNVYHTGTVTGTSYVGGIVGYNIDYTEQIEVEWVNNKPKAINGDTYRGTVECAYNTGSVTGTGNASYVGGIAGHSKGVIREVFNTGTVSGTGSTSEVGGIVGDMYNRGASVENAYNTGAITGAFYVGGIAGSSQGKLTNVYNTGTVTGTGTNMKVGSLVGNEDGFLTNAYSISGVASALTGTYLTVNDTNVAELSAEEMKTPAKFVGFGFTQNTDGSYTGFTESGVWRIYENKTTPFLAAFPIPEPADPSNPGTTNPTNPSTTNPTNPGTTNPSNPGTTNPTNPGTTNPTNPGTTDPTNPGTTDPSNPGTTNPTNPGTTNPTNPGTTDPTNPGTTDPTNPGTTNPTNPLNPTNPVSAGDPTPQPEQKPQDIVKNVTENRGAAQEYTNVVGSINSGASTAMPTSGGTPVLNAPEAPTQNAAPTTGATGETQGAAAQKQSGGEAQQPNENPPQQQTTGGQIAAGKQETQLGITYTDINMPESMSVEALATSLNGGATATTPNNAGGEATQNGPATEPTATTGGNMSGASEEDEA